MKLALTVFKREFILPVAAFLVAYSLRYHFLVTYRFPLMIHEQDAVGYMDVAKTFLQWQLPGVSGRPPGYPIVIALFALLPVGLEYAARLASISMDALIVFPLFFISRIYLSRVGSFAVCLLWAFFSFSLIFSTSPLSQSSYLFYLLSGIAFLHLGLEMKRLGAFVGAGAFFALSYLARPEGAVGFGCGLFLCLIAIAGKGGANKKNLLIP
ncbi:MAG: glycosyltransferase family 39 protein, partial [Desulfuromonadaceae bacterium]